METGNKSKVISCIWDNPQPVFGTDAKQRAKRWELDGGKFSLIRKTRGEGLTVLANHGSNMGGSSWDVFTFLQDEVLHTAGYKETLVECARRYGVTLEFTKEEREKMKRAELIREVIPSFVASLNEHQEGEAAQYIKGRGFTIDNHFGELTAQSIQRAKDHLKATGKAYDGTDLFAELERLEGMGYNLVIPYYHNGSATGLKVRNIKTPTPTGSDGKPLSKYKNVTGLHRNGYCDRLKADVKGNFAVVVEGELDAIALIQSGVENVVSMGGAEWSEEAARMLDGYGVKALVYVPDVEKVKNGTGEQRTDIIDKAVRKFQQYSDGDLDLYISVLPDDGRDKMDVADYFKEHGAEQLKASIDGKMFTWWDYELGLFEDEIAAREATGTTVYEWEVKQRFKDIYSRCNPIDRQRIKDNIKGVPMYQAKGITPEALENVDEWDRQTDYTNRIKAAASDLTQAIEAGANPVKVAEIVRRLSNAQTTNTRDEWDKQFTASFEDLLEQVKNQPPTLKTKWELGTLNKNTNIGGKAYIYTAREHIEFAPAAITVFCAPTSHGKTTILLQSAIDLIKDYPDKLFIYVSCEENQWQLFERSLNVCIDIATTPTGKDNLGNACFVSGARRKTIKAALRGDAQPPKGFVSGQWRELYDATQWAQLCSRINKEVEKFKADTFPHLKVVNTGGSVEGIVSNVRHSIEVCEAQGYEVGGVFVDYMQLLTSDGSNAARNYELKAVCNALKDCATETDIPFIIAAQLNREAIARRNDGGGLDGVTVSNIGEGADIERIANAIYLVWQVDKTKRDDYINTTDNKESSKRMGERSLRIFKRATNENGGKDLKEGYLYVESLKARNGNTGSWGLLKFDGEANRVGLNDSDKMEE